jgi:hypothetical protein
MILIARGNQSDNGSETQAGVGFLAFFMKTVQFISPLWSPA